MELWNKFSGKQFHKMTHCVENVSDNLLSSDELSIYDEEDIGLMIVSMAKFKYRDEKNAPAGVAILKLVKRERYLVNESTGQGSHPKINGLCG